jgi:hypothetical protein
MIEYELGIAVARPTPAAASDTSASVAGLSRPSFIVDSDEPQPLDYGWGSVQSPSSFKQKAKSRRQMP